MPNLSTNQDFTIEDVINTQIDLIRNYHKSHENECESERPASNEGTQHTVRYEEQKLNNNGPAHHHHGKGGMNTSSSVNNTPKNSNSNTQSDDAKYIEMSTSTEGEDKSHQHHDQTAASTSRISKFEGDKDKSYQQVGESTSSRISKKRQNADNKPPLNDYDSRIINSTGNDARNSTIINSENTHEMKISYHTIIGSPSCQHDVVDTTRSNKRLKAVDADHIGEKRTSAINVNAEIKDPTENNSNPRTSKLRRGDDPTLTPPPPAMPKKRQISDISTTIDSNIRIPASIEKNYERSRFINGDNPSSSSSNHHFNDSMKKSKIARSDTFCDDSDATKNIPNSSNLVKKSMDDKKAQCEDSHTSKSNEGISSQISRKNLTNEAKGTTISTSTKASDKIPKKQQKKKKIFGYDSDSSSSDEEEQLSVNRPRLTQVTKKRQTVDDTTHHVNIARSRYYENPSLFGHHPRKGPSTEANDQCLDEFGRLRQKKNQDQVDKRLSQNQKAECQIAECQTAESNKNSNVDLSSGMNKSILTNALSFLADVFNQNKINEHHGVNIDSCGRHQNENIHIAERDGDGLPSTEKMQTEQEGTSSEINHVSAPSDSTRRSNAPKTTSRTKKCSTHSDTTRNNPGIKREARDTLNLPANTTTTKTINPKASILELSLNKHNMEETESLSNSSNRNKRLGCVKEGVVTNRDPDDDGDRNNEVHKARNDPHIKQEMKLESDGLDLSSNSAANTTNSNTSIFENNKASSLDKHDIKETEPILASNKPPHHRREDFVMSQDLFDDCDNSDGSDEVQFVKVYKARDSLERKPQRVAARNKINSSMNVAKERSTSLYSNTNSKNNAHTTTRSGTEEHSTQDNTTRNNLVVKKEAKLDTDSLDLSASTATKTINAEISLFEHNEVSYLNQHHVQETDPVANTSSKPPDCGREEVITIQDQVEEGSEHDEVHFLKVSHKARDSLERKLQQAASRNKVNSRMNTNTKEESTSWSSDYRYVYAARNTGEKEKVSVDNPVNPTFHQNHGVQSSRYSRNSNGKDAPKQKKTTKTNEKDSIRYQEQRHREQERLLRESAQRVRENQARENRIQQQTRNLSASNYTNFVRPIQDVTLLPDNHWKWSNPYSRLGLPQNSDSDLVKKHYRKLCLRYHPDKAKHLRDGPDRFQAIKEAYEIISNNTRR